MTPIPVGLIGYGFAGSVFHAPLIGAVPGLALKRIASGDVARVRRDFPEMQVDAESAALLRDPQIQLVVIATPNTSHFPLAQAALRAGKHVVIDKPFVVSSEEGQELIRLAKQQGRVLSVFHNRRWDNDFLTLRRCVDAGLLGEVRSYEAHYDRFVPEVAVRWREQPQPGSGVLWDLGSHLIDQALQLFGLPHSVSADVATQRPGAQVDDYFHLLLDYGSLKVILHAGMLVREPGPRYEVHGTRGSFVKYGIDSQEDALLRGERPGHPQWGHDDPAHCAQLTTELHGMMLRGAVDTVPGRYEAYYHGVAEAIARGENPPVSAEEALQVVRLIESAQKSARERRTISLA